MINPETIICSRPGRKDRFSFLMKLSDDAFVERLSSLSDETLERLYQNEALDSKRRQMIDDEFWHSQQFHYDDEDDKDDEDDDDDDDSEFNKNLSKQTAHVRVCAFKIESAKRDQVYDKHQRKIKARAAGEPQLKKKAHPTFRCPKTMVEHDKHDFDCKDHLEDDDFDDKEEDDSGVCPFEEEFDYNDLHVCPMTIAYYEDYMMRRNEWFDRYFEELYAQRELEQAEKDYFIESCWDAILVNCH
jgi:hypothetical protein